MTEFEKAVLETYIKLYVGNVVDCIAECNTVPPADGGSNYAGASDMEVVEEEFDMPKGSAVEFLKKLDREKLNLYCGIAESVVESVAAKAAMELE